MSEAVHENKGSTTRDNASAECTLYSVHCVVPTSRSIARISCSRFSMLPLHSLCLSLPALSPVDPHTDCMTHPLSLCLVSRVPLTLAPLCRCCSLRFACTCCLRRRRRSSGCSLRRRTGCQLLQSAPASPSFPRTQHRLSLAPSLSRLTHPTRYPFTTACLQQPVSHTLAIIIASWPQQLRRTQVRRSWRSLWVKQVCESRS